MSTQVEGRQWFDALLARNRPQPADADPPWLNETRQRARVAIGELTIPQRKQETWRYTDFSQFYAIPYSDQTSAVTAVDNDDIEEWIYPDAQSYRVVLVNGHYVPGLSSIEQLPETIRVGSLHAAMATDASLVQTYLDKNRDRESDVFSELNRAFLDDGLFIHVAANTEVPLPVEVVYLNLSVEQESLCQPHSLVVLEQGARVKLVERFISSGESSYFFNGVSEVVLADQAGMQHYRLQDESRNARHLGRVLLQQHSGSEYRAVHIATGAAWSRCDIHIDFAGRHANCDLQGAYLAGTQQYTDFHLDVRHSQANCRSREDFRGIVYGKGRAVFDGRIVVDKGAQHSDAQLNNRNLLLSEDAEIDTKPQLEIYADDVKCGHGTTVGRLDPQQIFYLRSRGIPETQARRMLCLGFVGQILAELDDERVHDFILAKINARLQLQEVAE